MLELYCLTLVQTTLQTCNNQLNVKSCCMIDDMLLFCRYVFIVAELNKIQYFGII